ncbi:MAG: MazG family protein, partial [Anaerolineae bacterium]
ERILEAAGHGPVAYAVPGSGAVGEASVLLLRERARGAGLPWEEIPGVSFLEPTLAALGWDALGGLQIGDATEVAALYHPPLDPDRPALVAQVYSRRVAADLKLTLLNQYPPVHGVSLVFGAGIDGGRLAAMELADLDRRDDFDDTTTLAVPAIGGKGPPDLRRRPIGASVYTMAQMMARLRASDGCPWDLEQSHESLGPYLLEETYEVLAAVDSGDTEALREELGDLLLQVLFHAQIAVEGGEFSLADVVRGITRKIVGRHPHVFGTAAAATAADVRRRWDEWKREERGQQGTDDPLAGVPRELPALARAQAVQERLARAGAPPPAPGEVAGGGGLGPLLWKIVGEAVAQDTDAESALRVEIERRLRAHRGAAPRQEP